MRFHSSRTYHRLLPAFAALVLLTAPASVSAQDETGAATAPGDRATGGGDASASDPRRPATDPPIPETFKLQVKTPDERVLPARRRVETMAIADWLLDFHDPSFPVLVDNVGNPFLFREPPEPEEPEEPTEPEPEVEEEPEEAPPRPQISREIAPRILLEEVGPRFKSRVRGTIMLGDEAYLLTEDGQRLPVGFTFAASTTADTSRRYTVRIAAIEPRTFTLAIGDEELTLAVPESETSGTITRP